MTSSTQGFSFGTTPATTSGFAFGSALPTAQSTGFGGFGFGSAASAGQNSGFGLTSAAPSTGLSFGANTGSSLFGATTTTQSAGFGGFGSSTGSSGLFGAATGGAGLFGGSSASGIGIGTGVGFGAFKPATGLQGAQANTSSNAQAISNSLVNLKQAITNPVVFADERDQVIMKWNQVQSCWGVGKGFYTQQGAFVDFTPDNPYFLLKAVGYSCISDSKNEDGLVNLVFGRSQEEVSTNQQQIVDALHKFLGSRTNLIVCVDSIKPLLGDKCEMTMYVQDRQVTGVTTRILASELFTFLNQQNIRQQLLSQICVSDVYIKVAMTKEQMKYYLDNPPTGIDHRIWEQAKIDNPDPQKLLPVPIVGFSELHQRLKYQDQQTQMHRLRIDVISADLSSLKCKLADMVAKIDEFKRRQVLMGHRVLQVMVKQEIARKQGYAIQSEEELLSTQLESIAAELNAPTQFKGRLNELMSQIRMQNHACIMRSDVGFQITDEVQQEIKQHLNRQQEGISHLVQVLREDLADLKVLEQSVAEVSKLRR